MGVQINPYGLPDGRYIGVSSPGWVGGPRPSIPDL